MPKDIELQSKSEDSLENNNVIIQNRRKLSVNILNWTLLLIASCIVTFVITNKFYGINNVTVNNNNHRSLETISKVFHRRILKESNEMRKPTLSPESTITIVEPTLQPSEEPTISLTHSPDFLSAAPSPSLSHSPNFLSAAPSPSYTHAPNYPKTIPPTENESHRKLKYVVPDRTVPTVQPSEEPTEFAPAVYFTKSPNVHYTHYPTKASRKLQAIRNTQVPTLEPTEMVHKTRSPNHYRTKSPTGEPSNSPPTNWPLLFQDSTSEEEDSTESFKKMRVLGSKKLPVHTSEPTEEPTPFAPAVYRTEQPTLTKSPNSHYTESPNIQYTLHPTEDSVRKLRKDVSRRVTPTLEPTEMVHKTRSPNHFKTRTPTLEPTESS